MGQDSGDEGAVGADVAAASDEIGFGAVVMHDCLGEADEAVHDRGRGNGGSRGSVRDGIGRWFFGGIRHDCSLARLNVAEAMLSVLQ